MEFVKLFSLKLTSKMPISLGKLFSLKLTSKMPISLGGGGGGGGGGEGGREDQFKWKMIPSSRPKFSDLYTLSQSKLLENHTLHSGTHLYNPYMAVNLLANCL